MASEKYKGKSSTISFIYSAPYFIFTQSLKIKTSTYFWDLLREDTHLEPLLEVKVKREHFTKDHHMMEADTLVLLSLT